MSNKVMISAVCVLAVGCLAAHSKARTTLPSDAAFLAMAAQADMTIAHIGQMAEDRALTGLAAKGGDTIPKAINERNERTIASLDRSRGKAFDRAFLLNQSAEHERLIGTFKLEAEHGSNPAIKEYARKALPTMEQHLHDAQDLLQGRS
jgi:predicted outer membrane protein